MKDSLQKIKLFYTQMMAKRETYSRHGIKPARDWSIILIICAILFCGLGILAFYFYVQIGKDQLFTNNGINILTELKINDSLFKKTIDDINLREELTDEIKGSKIKSPDPSL